MTLKIIASSLDVVSSVPDFIEPTPPFGGRMSYFFSVLHTPSFVLAPPFAILSAVKGSGDFRVRYCGIFFSSTVPSFNLTEYILAFPVPENRSLFSLFSQSHGLPLFCYEDVSSDSSQIRKLFPLSR